MIIPLLPFFVEDAGNSEVWVGMILSLQYVGVIFGNNAIGFISDRVGRKFALLLSMAGDTAFFVASGYAKSSLMLLIFRVFAGAFTPLAPSLTWLLDSVDPR
jgi:MFS family permease